MRGLLPLLLLSVSVPAAAQGYGPGPVLVRFETTAGAFTLALDAQRAPLSAANFVRYVSAGHYHSRRVEFVHTGPSPTFFGGTLNDSPDRTAAWLRQANVEVERLIHRDFRGPEGCRVQVRVLGSAGFHDLLDQLRQGDTDLILVGKSETNGAFVEKLARKAPCSVMVVPPGRSVAYRRILVTRDFSAESARAMEVAVAFAKARKLKQLRCFHAYQITRGHLKTGIPQGRFREELESWAQDRYREFQKTVNWGGLTAAFACEEGPVAARAILRQAASR